MSKKKLLSISLKVITAITVILSIYAFAFEKDPTVGSLVGGLSAVMAFIIYLLGHYDKQSSNAEKKPYNFKKEIDYLYSFQEYIKYLDRPLGYTPEEYTTPSTILKDKDTIPLTFFVHEGHKNDQKGLSPKDIIPTSEDKYIKKIDNFVTNTKEPIIILGEPGSGKSVTLRHIALDIAKREHTKKSKKTIIPIYVNLGAYNQKQTDGKPITVLEFIENQLKDVVIGGEFIVESIDRILREKRAVILLDSMDEIPSKDFLLRTEEIKKFVMKYGNNKILIACRKREYSDDFKYSELIIEPFNNQKIKKYLEVNWQQHSKRYFNPEKRHILYPEYLKISEPNHPLYVFASNPFFLKLITNYFYTNGELPNNQSDIFNNYINEKIERESCKNEFPIEVKNNLFNIWAALSYGVIKNDLGTYFYYEDISKIIDNTEHFSEAEIKNAIEIAIKCGLMRKENDNSIRFEHHRLLEYLAAWHWDKNKTSEIVESNHLVNPWRRETLMLRSGITNTPNEFIREIIYALDYDRFVELLYGAPQEYSIDLERLDSLAAFEVVMNCARQRWNELDDELKDELKLYTECIADNGRLIEQVRLVRMMFGLPIGFYAPFFMQMANSKSDWLINELFSVVDKNDYESVEYADLVECFIKSKNEKNIFERLGTIKNLSLTQYIKKQKKNRTKTISLLVKKIIDSYGILAISLLFIFLFIFLFNAFESKNLISYENIWKPIVIIFVLLFYLWINSGWRITIIATTLSILFILYLSFFKLGENNSKGIGIVFGIENDTILVVNTIPDGPSEKIGILEGDRIVTVNDSAVVGVGITNEQVAMLLRGEEGTSVKIGISRKDNDELLHFDITRLIDIRRTDYVTLLLYLLLIGFIAYFMTIGKEFNRAKWMKNYFKRTFVLFRSISVFLRIFFLFYFFVILAITWSEFGCTYNGKSALVIAVLSAIVAEFLFYFVQIRTVKNIITKNANTNDSDEIKTNLERYVFELSKPRPEKLNKKILEQIGNLKLDKVYVINALQKLSESEQHFFKSEDILEMIEKIDLRRRQLI